MEKPIVVIETSKGTMELELWADVAPKTVANFVKLANEKFYEEEEMTEERNRQFNLGMITKSNKELNLRKVNSTLDDEQETGVMKMQLKEFDNFKKAIMFMVKEKFPYVSYIYGGFNEVHSFSMKYKVSLLGHKKECYICAKKEKEKNGLIKSFKNFGKMFKKTFHINRRDSYKKEESINNSLVNFEFKHEFTLDEIDKIFDNKSIIKYIGQSREDIDTENKLLPNSEEPQNKRNLKFVSNRQNQAS